MAYPARRVDHYPRQPIVDDDGTHIVECSCGQTFDGDTLEEAADRWGHHDDEETETR